MWGFKPYFNWISGPVDLTLRLRWCAHSFDFYLVEGSMLLFRLELGDIKVLHLSVDLLRDCYLLLLGLVLCL